MLDIVMLSILTLSVFVVGLGIILTVFMMSFYV